MHFRLRISNVQSSDYGSYTYEIIVNIIHYAHQLFLLRCQVKNPLGEAQGTIRLYETHNKRNHQEFYSTKESSNKKKYFVATKNSFSTEDSTDGINHFSIQTCSCSNYNQ